MRFVDETPYVAEDSYPLISVPVCNTHHDAALLRQSPRKADNGTGCTDPPHTAAQYDFVDSEDRPLCSIPEGSRLLLHSLSSAITAHALAFPLRDAGEARLMKYYLEYMCNWVSMTDAAQLYD